MLAASCNGVGALRTLLGAGATLELQDALGRSALMFAAGNCAGDTCQALLDAGEPPNLRHVNCDKSVEPWWSCDELAAVGFLMG